MMIVFIRYFLFFLVVFLFTTAYNFAQNIKYSVGPVCKDKKVVCRLKSEEPVCVVLNPRVHVEKIEVAGRINKFQPVCISYGGSFFPGCVDLTTSTYPHVKGVVVECIERVKCIKDGNAAFAYCEDGKIPTCLGSDDKPDCLSSEICKDNSLPVCDYVWEAKGHKSSSL